MKSLGVFLAEMEFNAALQAFLTERLAHTDDEEDLDAAVGELVDAFRDRC